MSLAREIAHVALLLQREASFRETGQQGDSKLSAGERASEADGASLAAVRKLRRLAMRLHRSYENACNREQTARELRRERDDEARALYLCYRAFGIVARFNGDPRGAPLQIPASRANANSWGGDAIVIPYLPAREYRQ